MDIAWGGMFYAIVEAADVGLTLDPSSAGDIVRLGEMIKVATREQHPVHHPDFEYIGPDILAFRDSPSAKAVAERGAHARNAVVMSTGKLEWEDPSTWRGNIDRSPCGSGTSAIMALLHAKGELPDGPFVHKSVVGGIFVGEVVAESEAGITTTITGQACVSQITEVVVDAEDPFPEGFTLRDIW